MGSVAGDRGQWSSRAGFVLAAAGSAVGLGNIWRFPYLAGENGGAAFVFAYVAFVVLIGLPYMLAELSLGRSTQKNPVGAIVSVRGRTHWRFVGWLGVITAVGILSFYSVIAGWTIGYIFKMATGRTADFAGFIASPVIVLSLLAFFMLLTALIVLGGVHGGIERWSKVLMPLLFVLLIALIIYANTLEGAKDGLAFYVKPDFTKLTGRTLLAALGQAFFSLSLGMGLMVTYGSYASKKEDLVTAGVAICFFDTLVAICAGFVIFPALFSMGHDPAAGPTLVFAVLPELFQRMPGGLIVGALFFVLLAVAALTSTISLLEVQVAYVVDEHRISRRRVVWGASLLTFLVAVPSALSQGASGFWGNVGWIPERLTSPDFLSQMSFAFGDFSLAFGALLLSTFVGWVWGADKAAEELAHESPRFVRARAAWIFFIRFVVPIVVSVILLNLFGIFG
jgi:NSS family neurotransmitter:Na+ symporter